MKRTAKSDSNATTPEDVAIGHMLVSARESTGLNQNEVAARAGWLKTDEETPHQQRVSHYETGRRRISLIDFIDYAAALGMSPCDVLKFRIPLARRKGQTRGPKVDG